MKRFWSLCALLGLVAMLGCGPSDNSDTKYTMAVIPKGLSHEFWLTVKAGAEEAGKDLDVKIIWNGPAEETQVAEQINIFQDMISRGVDAVVLAACDENALIEPIRNAMDDGVPIITMDSGVNSDLPISFVATDNIAGAKKAADYLAEILDGKGELGLIPFVPGAGTSEMRENGFKDGVEAHSGMKVVSTLYSHSDPAKALAAAEDMMTAHSNLAGIFAASEPSCIGAIQAIEAAGKAGEIKLVAFDAASEQIAALRRGTIQALIVQSPFRMGYDSVKAAVDHIEGRSVPKRIDTGVTVVTLENLDTPEVQKLLNPLD